MEGITEAVENDTEVIYEQEPSKQTLEREDISLAIIAVGEVPYAESFGDNEKLEIPSDTTNTIISVAEKFPTLMILISGRALVLDPKLLENIEGLIAAWWPGTEGGGIGDLVFGDYEFEGKLPMAWLRSVEQLPIETENEGSDALFPFGFGLTKSEAKSKRKEELERNLPELKRQKLDSEAEPAITFKISKPEGEKQIGVVIETLNF